MNASKDPALASFYDWLRTQPLPENPDKFYTQERLADDLCTGRAHLSQVLGGKLSGRHTWKRIVKSLPVEGIKLLRKCSTWNSVAEKAYVARAAREMEFAVHA